MDLNSKKIRVGIVGANPDRSWAARAHVPALQALPEYEITAVGTTRAESARSAAREFGAAHAFTDAAELARHPDVDLVAVTVKVPAHAEPVRAALAAGKHVYCEWPLARTTAEAAELTAAAEAAGVHHTVGLQARLSPALRHARELIESGRIGRVVSASVHATRGKGAGRRVPAWGAYTLDRSNGAGTLEVAGGHTLDALQYLLGDIEDLSATLSVQHPVAVVAETGAEVAATSPDHLLLHATLTGGASASVHLHDARSSNAGTRIDISGTDGDLALVSAGPYAPAGIQIGDLRLWGAAAGEHTWQEIPVPGAQDIPGLADETEGANVARQYARLAADLRSGTRGGTDFAAGLRLHRLLDAVRRSAASGTRVTV
ncbi:Gfo/Idh/MocA family oxidoreductase [Streptomyces sp. NPDC050315]|uniref:Gfo/Idh/MocA family protein n=1 Tax=Streptomyces sp. NPDC050315 TaxID=3155039 RepID=UPI003444AB71